MQLGALALRLPTHPNILTDTTCSGLQPYARDRFASAVSGHGNVTARFAEPSVTTYFQTQSITHCLSPLVLHPAVARSSSCRMCRFTRVNLFLGTMRNTSPPR
jgi:hypothetical protein